MSNWKGIVQKLAPTLGTALGGPFAGMATKFLADKFLGGDVDPRKDLEAQLEAAIVHATPEDYVRLKEVEQDFIYKMEELGLKRDQLAVDSTNNARELAKKNMGPHMVLSAVFLVGFFVALWAVMAGKTSIEQGMMQVAMLLLGMLVREVPTIMHFWFGSSMGSKAKDQERLEVAMRGGK